MNVPLTANVHCRWRCIFLFCGFFKSNLGRVCTDVSREKRHVDAPDSADRIVCAQRSEILRNTAPSTAQPITAWSFCDLLKTPRTYEENPKILLSKPTANMYFHGGRSIQLAYVLYVVRAVIVILRVNSRRCLVERL